MSKRKDRIVAIVALSFAFGLEALGPGCTVNVVAPPSSDTGGTGAGTNVAGSGTIGTDPGTTPPDPNPNSPCADKTNIYVSYVNESSANVTFVEGFHDQNKQGISTSMVLLRPTGDPNATKDKCILCPWTAGVHNITFTTPDGSVRAPWPPDLTRNAGFKCGDHLTFTFKADQTVHTAVQTR